jgi:hypothetical protein
MQLFRLKMSLLHGDTCGIHLSYGPIFPCVTVMGRYFFDLRHPLIRGLNLTCTDLTERCIFKIWKYHIGIQFLPSVQKLENDTIRPVFPDTI